ncbi:MAG: NIPSNAP family protein [Chitinophagaceae bacterium]|nr:NIPSNAP family protein [Chitinophagaceae bacterium]
MNRLLFATLIFLCISASAQKREHYEIKVYHVKTNEQVQQVDQFLKDAYLPALHKLGIKQVGVFHHIDNDTAADKRVFVFIPLKSLDQVSDVADLDIKDASLQDQPYWKAAYNASPFSRIETIVLKSFAMMTKYQAPSLTGPKTDRIYELRSYEGPTERLYRKKVEMFNEGGEVALFKRLNFNAVFYAEVIAGSHMPNLMYMTSFNDRADRDAHWKTFGADPEWVKLKDLPQYLNTVSKNDTMLLHPTEFSEL